VLFDEEQVNSALQLQSPRDGRRELAGTAGRWLLIAVDLHSRRRYLLLRRDLKADAADAKIFGSHSLDVGRGYGEVAIQIGVQPAGIAGEHVVVVQQVRSPAEAAHALQLADLLGLEAIDRALHLFVGGRLSLDSIQL